MKKPPLPAIGWALRNSGHFPSSKDCSLNFTLVMVTETSFFFFYILKINNRVNTERRGREEGEGVGESFNIQGAITKKDNKKESVWRENKCLRRKCWGVNML